MMPGRPGEISSRKAARMLERSEKTVRKWCRDPASPLESSRKDRAGRWWLCRDEVAAIAETYT